VKPDEANNNYAAKTATAAIKYVSQIMVAVDVGSTEDR